MNDFANFVNLEPDEKLIYDLLKSGRHTQLQIAKRLKWLGSDETHEGYAGRETTLRRVRKLIHEIRKHGIAVVSSKDGYELCQSRDAKLEYLNMSIRKEAVRIKNARDYHVKLMKEWGVNENELQLNLELK